MDLRLWELAVLMMLACVGAGFAVALDNGIFATLFTAEAAWAGVEVLYLSQ